jgi:hypothetical protein
MREPVQFGVRPLRSMKSSFSLAGEIKRIRTEHWKQNIPARYHRLPKLGARPKCNVARKDSEGLKQVGGYRIGLQRDDRRPVSAGAPSTTAWFSPVAV